MANLHPSPKGQFKKGDPRINKAGKHVGCKDKLTLLKEKLIDHALNTNLHDKRIAKSDIIKIAAGFVPKEVSAKLEGSLEIRWLE